jgi:hypothetical protein
MACFRVGTGRFGRLILYHAFEMSCFRLGTGRFRRLILYHAFEISCFRVVTGRFGRLILYHAFEMSCFRVGTGRFGRLIPYHALEMSGFRLGTGRFGRLIYIEHFTSLCPIFDTMRQGRHFDIPNCNHHSLKPIIGYHRCLHLLVSYRNACPSCKLIWCGLFATSLPTEILNRPFKIGVFRKPMIWHRRQSLFLLRTLQKWILTKRTNVKN